MKPRAYLTEMRGEGALEGKLQARVERDGVDGVLVTLEGRDQDGVVGGSVHCLRASFLLAFFSLFSP